MGNKGVNKGKQIVGWIKIITLLGMALEKGEGLEIVDPLLVNGADIKTMISNVQSQSEFVLLYDENYKLEIRDKKGVKLLSFQSDEEHINEFDNAIQKEVYALNHNLLDTRFAMFGNDTFKETYNEVTNMPVRFDHIDRQEECNYQIEGAERLLDFVNVLTGGDLNILKLGNEKEDDSVVRFFDADEGKYVESTISDVLLVALERLGLDEEEIKQYFNKEVPSLESKVATEDVIVGDDTQLDTVVYSVDSKKNLVETAPGIYEYMGDEKIKLASEKEIIGFIELAVEEINIVSGHDEEQDAVELREFLREGIRTNRLTKDDIEDFYKFVTLRKENHGQRALMTANRNCKNLVKDYMLESGEKKFNGKSIKSLQGQELVDFFNAKKEEQENIYYKLGYEVEKGEEQLAKYASGKITTKDYVDMKKQLVDDKEVEQIEALDKADELAKSATLATLYQHYQMIDGRLKTYERNKAELDIAKANEEVFEAGMNVDMADVYALFTDDVAYVNEAESSEIPNIADDGWHEDMEDVKQTANSMEQDIDSIDLE